MDCITISNLEVFAFHGVLKEENSLGQKFLISAELYTDIAEAAREDDIAKSINYASVCKAMEAFLKEHTFKLIETSAEQLARHLLINYRRISKIKLEIKKPWAPILMSLDTVSVVIERSWHEAYLGIGSNMGDKEAYLKEAIRLLDQEEDCSVDRISTFYITKPVGNVDQEDFLNGALCIKTLKTPEELLCLIQKIEQALKRERIIHWGPRTIDLDILFYDNLVLYTDKLKIPHPEIPNRGFVLEPLNEIAPFIKHPLLGETVQQMYKKLI